MEQAYIIARLKEMTMPELLDAIAEAHAGEATDIYEHLDPTLIDKTPTQYVSLLKLLSQSKKTK